MWDVGGLFGVFIFSFFFLLDAFSKIDTIECAEYVIRLHITSSSVQCNVDSFFLLNFFWMIAPHVCVQVANTHKIIDSSDSAESKHTDRDECRCVEPKSLCKRNIRRRFQMKTIQCCWYSSSVLRCGFQKF